MSVLRPYLDTILNREIWRKKKTKASAPRQERRSRSTSGVRKRSSRHLEDDVLVSDVKKVVINRRYVLYLNGNPFLHLPGGKLLDLMSHLFQVNVVSDQPSFHLVSARLSNTKDNNAVDIVGKVTFRIDLSDYLKILRTVHCLFTSNPRDCLFVAYVLQATRESLVAMSSSCTSDEIVSCDGMHEFSVFTDLQERLRDISVELLSFRVLSVSLAEEAVVCTGEE